MKAVRLRELRKPLEMQEIDIPPVGIKDVLVRVKAAGICHSDVHYRAGTSAVNPLPLTLGHEVAGIVEKTGTQVTTLKTGDRVCIHYMVTCGDCYYCDQGSEQFCTSGKMIGKYRDGGYAEYISVPARNAFLLPSEIPFDQAAVMMCSSATSFHALKKSRLKTGESVAVFGIGGLGISAVQIAKALGALKVYAVDIKENKLDMAGKFGAVPINAAKTDPVQEIHKMTRGKGVDVAMELIGLPLTMKQAVRSLAVFGRAVMAGITDKAFEINAYDELINKESEIIGVSDHLAKELPFLIELIKQGKLDLSNVITCSIPLDAEAINDTLDKLENFSEDMRVVITP